MSMLIAGRLARRGQLLEGWVEVEGDLIAAVGEGSPPRRPDEDEDIVAPGFVDLQVNGYGGVDFARADATAYQLAGGALLEGGVTAFQPTLITAP